MIDFLDDANKYTCKTELLPLTHQLPCCYVKFQIIIYYQSYLFMCQIIPKLSVLFTPLWVLGRLSELAFPHIWCCLSAIPSDLMKSTAVDESLSSMNQQFCSRENQLLQMLQQNQKSTRIYLFLCQIIKKISVHVSNLK